MRLHFNTIPGKFIIYGFAIVLALRLCMIFTMGMMPQDAYYYFYSTHLSLSYFDHPPGVAIMLWLFTKVLGTQLWALKLTDFIVTSLGLYVLFVFAKRFLTTPRALLVVCIFGSTLMVTDMSIVSTPDVPLFVFWTLALTTLHVAISQDRAWQWMLAGALSGLAFDCKYTALFLPVALFLFLMLSRQHRRYILSWRPFVFVVMFAIAILPVVLWNLQHDFASFQFQSGSRVSSIMEMKVRPVYFFAVMGHQTALLLPTLAAIMMLVFLKLIRKSWKQSRLPERDTLFLLCFSVPLILAFLLISWVYWVKINWMIPSYIAASVLVIRFMSQRLQRWHMVIAILVNALLLIQFLFNPIRIQSDDTYNGWRELSSEIKTLLKQYPDHFIFSADGYKTTAILNYYLDSQIYAGNIIGQHALEYSITDTDLTSLNGKSALYIDSRNMFSDFGQPYTPPDELSNWFESIRLLPLINIRNSKGKIIRQFAVTECIHYTGSKE